MNRPTLHDKLIEAAESLGWSVYEDEGGFEISKYSPAGEDFSFFVPGKAKSLVNQVARYAADFDADEHAEMWVESRGKNGVPDSIRALIDDADAIQEMLDELTEALAAAQKEYYQSFQQQK